MAGQRVLDLVDDAHPPRPEDTHHAELLREHRALREALPRLRHRSASLAPPAGRPDGTPARARKRSWRTPPANNPAARPGGASRRAFRARPGGASRRAFRTRLWPPCATIAPVPLKETMGDPAESVRGGARLTPRLIRVMRYEEIEAGGGPVIDLGSETVSLGRGDTESVRREGDAVAVDVTDAMMSRQHARIAPAGAGDYVIEDLGSRNGTYVEGRPVRRASLEDGQLIETGRTAWLFRLAPAGAPSSLQLGPTRSFSPRVFAVAEHLTRLAPAAVSLLLLGETGTARASSLACSTRAPARGRSSPSTAAALPENLLESEIFGHSGAFTGAIGTARATSWRPPGAPSSSTSRGDAAPPPGQAARRAPGARGPRRRRLEGAPLGSTCASSPPPTAISPSASPPAPSARISYARLEGWVLVLPRLAERREDIGELAAHVVRSLGRPHARATIRAARALLAFDWPFNIRQLVKTTEAALALAQSGPIEFDHLPERVRGGDAPGGARAATGPTTTTAVTATGATASAPAAPRAEDALDAEERELRERVAAALRAHSGNVTRAAQALGKQRQQMQRWMRRFGLRAEDFGGATED